MEHKWSANRCDAQSAERLLSAAKTLCAASRDVIVMWGFTDQESWIPSAFPGQGAALIFDASYRPKPAYTSLQSLLK